MVARSLLGMTPPPTERVITLRGFVPSAAGDDERAGDAPDPIASDGGAL